MHLVAILSFVFETVGSSIIFESRSTAELLTDLDSVRLTDMARFLMMYCNQVLTLLQFIKAGRTPDFELHLSAINALMKYYHAHDLSHYARMLPVYIQDMEKLRRDGPDNFARVADLYTVKRTISTFVNLFDDQALEQNIKTLKVNGGIVNITQKDEVSLLTS